ncbi:Phage protein [Pseudomonas chlororaphis subsp. piscium]|nr:Phage protein [Pseudomonas chlororaphis subsp. piscium]
MAYGRDALNAELGRLERLRDEAGRRARELKRVLGDSHA